MPLVPGSSVRAASHVASVATDDGFVVSHLVHSSIYVLEGTGGAVWAGIVAGGGADALVAGRGVDALVAGRGVDALVTGRGVDVGALVVALASEFDTPVSVVGPSVHDLLLDLVEKDLVEVLPPSV